MSLLTVPNTFTNGTGPANIIDATQMNANFTAVATAVNNIYPSQILPITSGQATFGATATGVGYKFLANDATAVPLTVSGVSGQSADIFDVTLTSGGTKAAWITNVGAFNVGSTAQAGTAGDGGFSRSATAGQIILGGATHAGALDYGVNTAQMFTMSAAGLIVGAGYTGGSVAGDIAGGRSTTQGVLWLGGSSTQMTLDWSLVVASQITARKSDGTYPQFNSGVYNNASDASLKTNVASVAGVYGLATVLQLKPASYNLLVDGKPSLGFIAQDVQPLLPMLINQDDHGTLLLNYDGMTPVVVQAIQDMCAKLHTAGVAGF